MTAPWRAGSLQAMPIHRRFLLAALPFVLAACTSLPAGTASAPPPKLVVFLAIDGLPQRQVTAYRDQLAPDGLARFLDRGAWFSDAHYGHAYTATGPGHATMLTGAYPHRTGIIGNEWVDPQTGARVYCAGDTAHRYIGHRTDPLDGTSPRNLMAETVGDVLRRADARSKVLAVSGKDRGAILPAGRTGVAYMYMDESGEFATSTYYMREHPSWVNAFNAAKPADRYFKAEWRPLLPDAAYARSLADNQPWFGPGGGRLPLAMNAPTDEKPGPAFYAALLRSPFADALTLEFAQAAVAGEKLGDDDAPDILSVSLSGHDYVNHRWSAESRLSHDHLLQVDRLLQDFFRKLDQAVGRDNYVAVLTTDHGFMPAPEHSRAQGLAAGKLSSSATVNLVNAELEKKFGTPKLVAGISAQGLLLDRKALSAKNLEAGAVAAAARALVVQQPGVAAAYTRRELETGSQRGFPHFEAIRKTWHKDRSADVQYVLKPHWMTSSSSTATHGSPHAYDTHVPILLWGPRWFRPGEVPGRVEVADIAPTLARLLGVPVPSSSEGRPLPVPAP
jgi:predicted AlkP superfamily pyrophosphatase or phosphodiesterase